MTLCVAKWNIIERFFKLSMKNQKKCVEPTCSHLIKPSTAHVTTFCHQLLQQLQPFCHHQICSVEAESAYYSLQIFLDLSQIVLRSSVSNNFKSCTALDCLNDSIGTIAICLYLFLWWMFAKFTWHDGHLAWCYHHLSPWLWIFLGNV